VVNLDRLLPIFAPALKRMLRNGQKSREAQFAAMPKAMGQIVFLGDSITEQGLWDGWFPHLPTLNRGIGGQAICDIASRLDTATYSPLAISLMIGTNDLHGLGQSSRVDDIAGQMRNLVRCIREMAPAAMLLINSVTPRSSHFRDRILQLNDMYRQIAAENDASFVDLWPVLAGEDGVIIQRFTTDGLHLSGDGYKAWTDILRPYLNALIRL
jgi:lysophospholipase L1-like esterase